MKPAFLRPLQTILPLLATLLLAACDAPPLLPADARLPDGSNYSGDFQDGFFHGDGVQRFASGRTYRGEFREGYWHGQGKLELPTGWRYEGGFEKGLMSGQGVLEHRGTRYEGEFQNGEFNGQGRYEVNEGVFVAEFADGTPIKGQHLTEYGVYEGEFYNWRYHGEGTFSYTGEFEGMQGMSGPWEHGQFVGELADVQDYTPVDRPAPLTEKILVEDLQRLNDQIQSLQPERPGVSDTYFLAVGGDGTESVFMRDIQVARTGLQKQFDIESRSIMLLNHRDYEIYPLATRPSIEKALRALDERMNPEEDILIVHLVSHGGKDGELVLRQPGIQLPGLSPETFAEMLEPLNARRKVLVVSACYSGQWLNQLKDSDTLILTSSRDDRTSFGCGDDSEMTWFTKALYQSVGLSLTDPEAMFEQITQQIRVREEEIGMEEERWSYPQFHLGEELRQWLERGSLNQK